MKQDYKESLKNLFYPTKTRIYAFAVMLVLEAAPYFFPLSFDPYSNFISFAMTMLLVGAPGAMAVGFSALFPFIDQMLLFRVFTVIYAYVMACIIVWAVKGLIKKKKSGK